MREAIEKVIEFLQDQQRVELDEMEYGIAQAYEIAIDKLKEVLDW